VGTIKGRKRAEHLFKGWHNERRGGGCGKDMFSQGLVYMTTSVAIDYYKPWGAIFCSFKAIFRFKVLNTFNVAIRAFWFSHGNLIDSLMETLIKQKLNES
jgi:hypothetical protein